MSFFLQPHATRGYATASQVFSGPISKFFIFCKFLVGALHQLAPP